MTETIGLVVIAGGAVVGPWLAWHNRDRWRGSPVPLTLATVYPVRFLMLVVEAVW